MGRKIATPLEEVLGKRIQHLRDEQPWTQDELAFVLRTLTGDTSWTRGVIAALETGGRHISVDDLFVLAYAFRRPAKELMPEAGMNLNIGGLAVTPRQARRILSGGTPPRATIQASSDLAQSLKPEQLEQLSEYAEWRRDSEDDDGPPLDDLIQDVQRDLERKTARRFPRENPFFLAHLARQLWGRSMTEQREWAAAKAGLQTAQAKRHITIELAEELEDALRQLEV